MSGLNLRKWVGTGAAWALAVATYVCVAVALGFGAERAAPDQSVIFNSGFSISFALLSTVGATIVTLKPGTTIGWVALLAGLGITANDAAHEYVAHSLEVHGLPLTHLVAWIGNWIFAPSFALMGILLLTFPTGKFPSKRWRIVAWGMVLPCVVVLVIAIGWWNRSSAFLIDDDAAGEALGAIGGAVIGSLFISLCAAAVSPFVRYRRAQGTERRQLKWIGYSAVLIAASTFMSVFIGPALGLSDEAADLIFGLIQVTALLSFPVAIGIAILRHGLFGIDVVINRTLVYGSLTALLAGGYLGLVALFQLILKPVTPESDVSIVISTLAVAAAFRPLRARVQTFIDRRFYRSRYDAAATLQGFSSRLRAEVDLASLSADLVEVVSATMRPAHASLWLNAGFGEPER